MPEKSEDLSKDLSDLPTELLLHIFDFLDPNDIANLSATCTKFKDMIDDSDQLTNKVSA
jgi:hypothetical protein